MKNETFYTKLENITLILHAGKKIKDIIKTLEELGILKPPRIDINFLAEEIRRISYYSPQIGFFLSQLYTAQKVMFTFFKKKLTKDLLLSVPAILEPTFLSGCIATIVKEKKTTLIINGTKLVPYLPLATSILAIGRRTRKTYALLLIQKNLVKIIKHMIDLPHLSTKLIPVAFRNFSIDSKSELVCYITHRELLEIFDWMMKMLNANIEGIRHWLIDEINTINRNTTLSNNALDINKNKLAHTPTIGQMANEIALTIESFGIYSLNPSSLVHLYLGSLIESSALVASLNKNLYINGKHTSTA